MDQASGKPFGAVAWAPRIASGMAWVIAAAITVYVGRFAYRTGVSVAIADSWHFIQEFVAHYNNGTLGLVDFFGKRPVGYDHSQPIQRAVLWLHMKLFQMDFGVEGAMGCVFAAGLAAFCAGLMRKELGTTVRGRYVAAFFTVCVFAGVFTLNARSVFDWSLVTLVFADILGATLLIAFAYRCLHEHRPLALFIATFIGCALMDTVAIMAVVAIAMLFVASAIRNSSDRRHLWLLFCIIAATVLYKFLYTWMFLSGNAGSESILSPMAKLLVGWPEAWKVVVVPLGGAFLSPSRIAAMYPDKLWLALSVGATITAVATAWFWVRFVRYSGERLPFVAAGLMLICYGSVAGVVLIRVPEYGFDYLLQPRYALFYTLQAVALLMMAAHAWARGASLVMRSAFAVGGAALLGLWGLYAYLTTLEEPFVRAYNQQMADQIHALWLEPGKTPTPCSPNILPCTWTPEMRAYAISQLEKGPWNVFAPHFRGRHHIHWQGQPPAQ